MSEVKIYSRLDAAASGQDDVFVHLKNHRTAQARITELEAERDEHARICLDWMSICGTQKKEIKELTAERDRLRDALERGRLAIGEHSAPEECYATGPLTGCAIQDLIVCPACAFIDAYDDITRDALKETDQ